MDDLSTKLEFYCGPQSRSGSKLDDCGTVVAGFLLKFSIFSGRVFLSGLFANKGEILPLKTCSTQLEPRVGERDVESSN